MLRSAYVCGLTLLISSAIMLIPAAIAHSTAALTGRVLDPSDAVVPAAHNTVERIETEELQTTRSDKEGNYQFPAMPVGTYRISVQAPGFQTYIMANITLEVGRAVVQDFKLSVGDASEQVMVQSDSLLVERVSTSVGAVIDRRTVQEIPLNGRYFLDLGLLVPGSVTPPQNAFSAAPTRGLGALAINTAGNREETVNYMINGITLNNLTFSSISFQPSINTIQEFKVDNSTFSAEYGQSSGAVVNIATRSGTNEFHGELFEFFRNHALDARNFFNFTSSSPPPFQRNQFGGSLGGPVFRNRSFFFVAYEGLRQRQGLNINSLVLSDAERASVTNPVIEGLIELIPQPNLVDSSGTPRFVGSATAPVDVDQWTLDLGYDFNPKDRLHGYYAIQRDQTSEPVRFGNTIPGFGNTREAQRQILTVNETHVFGAALVNELRAGFNRIYGVSTTNRQLNPADLGIRNGISQRVGLPQIDIAGGALNFGGPAPFPSGRADTTYVISNKLSGLFGRHSLKFGGEVRRFLNNNFRTGTGAFNFSSVDAFLAGNANSFSITLGEQTSSIAQGALGLFVQDNYKWRPNLTIEAGLRYDWNMTPVERYDRFIVFDTATSSLVRIGQGQDRIYHQNNRNLQPRLGFVWDPFQDGKTSLRGAYAILVDQPMTSVVLGSAANPPLATPLTYTGSVQLANAIDVARAAGLAPVTTDYGFDNAYLQSWNLNLQRELTRDFAAMAGYFGSKGTHLILRRNINQPVDGARPFPSLSASSAILPGATLGNITQVESTGNSGYHALWMSVTKRPAFGLQFNASYTWSKSLDYNSFSSQGIVAQDSYNLRADRAPSDYDARHRFVLSGIYELPFHQNRFVSGWQLAAIVQLQSGNPFNIVTSNSTINGVANTVRPDVRGPIEIIGTVERWFDTTMFATGTTFGNLGRNVVIGPDFRNTDFSVSKYTTLGERVRMLFRAEVFDLLNHPNFGEPGRVTGSPAFARITSTRFPTGEAGSSRQVQFALKLMF
jgi:outer membrane receptor protein involved in Fe transport